MTAVCAFVPYKIAKLESLKPKCESQSGNLVPDLNTNSTYHRMRHEMCQINFFTGEGTRQELRLESLLDPRIRCKLYDKIFKNDSLDRNPKIGNQNSGN